MSKNIISILKKHEAYRNRCINLSPSENVMSPAAKQAIQNDVGNRYYFDTIYSPSEGASYSYAGSKYISEMLIECQQTAKRVFEANYVSVYPISGHLANIGIIFAFTSLNDSIICHSPESGGYPGLDRERLPKYLNINVKYFPMRNDITTMIDIEKTIDLIRQVKPKLVIFSSAHTLFPPNISSLVGICKSINCKIIYDGSHPLGLIAGKEFIDPFKDGADIFVGGTQKSFPGPQGAIIATNKYVNEIKSVEQFVMVDNPHFHRIAALAIVLVEMDKYGEKYASQVVRNSKALARKLSEYGLPVLYKEKDFTESHMIKLEVFLGYENFTRTLEKVNIIIDSAGRIGTNEMTRME